MHVCLAVGDMRACNNWQNMGTIHNMYAGINRRVKHLFRPAGNYMGS